MRSIKLKARAKINLTLDVTGKREDGYHLLRSIMQTVGLYDDIFMQTIERDKILVRSNLPWLPTDERNLAYRGAAIMRERFNISQGVFIRMEKNIPVAAGLAGGSSDCAAVLVGMNRLFGLGLTASELMELGKSLGSDIPYCIKRGTMLAEGIGDILTPVERPCPLCYIVLAKLPVSVSTATVYRSLDWQSIEKHPDTEGMIRAMASGDIRRMGALLLNVLENVTIPMYPDIERLKAELLRRGAVGALMSGSGPTVFGIFEEKKTAKDGAEHIRREFGIRDVFLTEVYHPKR